MCFLGDESIVGKEANNHGDVFWKTGVMLMVIGRR